MNQKFDEPVMNRLPIDEKFNSITHAIGVLFILIAFPLLIIRVNASDNINYLYSICIYGLCYLLTFLFSTCYHSSLKSTKKARFKLLDRISIYFFIAATYTPFIVFYMFDSIGILLLLIMWLLAIFGIIFELFLIKKYYYISVLFYLLMGWMFIFVSNRFFQLMPSNIITLIFGGVFCYSFGVIFYVWKKWTFHHAVWHLFVLLGSFCHYAAIWLTVTNL